MAEYDISKITTPNGDTCNLKDKSKLPKDFSGLSAKTTPATGDVLPIESNGTTYKIDYNALAAAILAQASDRVLTHDNALTDCNTLTYGVGNYVTTTLNAPSNYGVICAFKSSIFCGQIGISNTNNFYMRKYQSNDNTWGQWGRVFTSKDVVDISHGGTEATTADGACANIGAVKKSGDTMTGMLAFETGNSNNGLSWISNNGTQFVFKRNDPNNNITLLVNGPNTSSTWKGALVINSDGRVMLSNPLDVAYGGTEATTAAGARANIGSGCPSGTFTTANGKTVTVTNGFITAIT